MRVGPGQGRYLVGREAELERLLAAYAAAQGGRSQVVVVQGEAGIGKTRLVRELADRIDGAADGPGRARSSRPTPLRESAATAEQGGAVVATGHGVDLAGGSIPYGLISALLDDLVLEVGPERAHDVLGPRATALAALVPSLGLRGTGS